MVLLKKHKTAFRHWKEIKRLPEPEIVGRPRLSFDILQEVAMHCDVETARTLGFLCREMNKRMRAKVLQPLGPYEMDGIHTPRLKIVKEEGVDELFLKANGKTVVAPLDRYMRYIWYLRCDFLEIYISKDEILAVWKQLYEHTRNVCGDITVNCTDDFLHEGDPSMADMVLRVIRPIREITRIIVARNTITIFHMDMAMDNSFGDDYQQCIRIEFPNSSEFSSEFFISVFESAPFSQLCHIALMSNFDTVRPAVAAFASTQRPVPEGVFTQLGDNDISFELVSSGTKLHVSDTMYSSYDSDEAFSVGDENEDFEDFYEMFDLNDYLYDDDDDYDYLGDLVNDLL